MKIFDFTNGHKGALLANVPLVHRQGCTRMVEGTTDKYASFKVSGMSFHEDAYNLSEQEYKPEDFGVQAICFCIGEFEGEGWAWSFLATTEWLTTNGYLDGYYLSRDKAQGGAK